MAYRWLILGCLVAALAGCGRGSNESLDSFTKRWYAAVNQRNAGDLFGMLDSSSQRRVRHDLELMRGLPPPAQKAAIDQLGGERVKSLLELTPEHYFALLWDRATQGGRPTMSIEAQGSDAAYMILALGGDHRQRIRLMIEGGRWVWVLPEDVAVEESSS